MRNGTAKQATTALLEKFVKYTLEHFAAEESLMQRAAYPKFLAHQRVHADLRLQVEKYLERSSNGEHAVSINLMTFLKYWLMNHIQKEDRDYAPFLSRGH